MKKVRRVAAGFYGLPGRQALWFLASSAPVATALPAAEPSRPTPEMVLQADVDRIYRDFVY